MSVCTTLELSMGCEPIVPISTWNSEKLNLGIEIRCPHCDASPEKVGTWGWYPTSTGEVRRFNCKQCNTTFNPAKLPFWKDKVSELIWRIAQLTIHDQVSVNMLAQIYSIPESTLRYLVTEIKRLLSESFQVAKQIQERLAPKPTDLATNFRIIYYDEGFLKILGATGFLLFTLDSEGVPISLAIESQRDGETIYCHFLQASTQLGGVDVIVADGAPAIKAAAKALRQEVILVQQIHSGNAKRSRINRYVPIANRKAMWETTIELHTGSLLTNIESKITVRKQKVYPPKYSPFKKRKTINKKRNRKIGIKVARKSTFTPTEGAIRKKNARSSQPHLLKGHELLLLTGTNLYEYELNFIPGHAEMNSPDCPSLSEIEGMLSIVQTAFPHQFITSNRAEVFNALYDRKNHAWGVTTLKHANQHARAWAVMKFYPKGAKKLIQQHNWNIPYSLLKNLGFLMFSKLEVK